MENRPEAESQLDFPYPAIPNQGSENINPEEFVSFMNKHFKGVKDEKGLFSAARG